MSIDYKKLFDLNFYFENSVSENGDLFRLIFLSFAFFLMFSGLFYALSITIFRQKKNDSVSLSVKKIWVQKFSNQIFWVSFLGLLFAFFRSEQAGADYFLLMRFWLALSIFVLVGVLLFNLYLLLKVLPKDINEIKRKMEKEMYIKGGRKNEKQ